MARKNVNTHKIIDAGNMAGSLTSAETDVKFQDQATILLEWSGTSPVGTVSVQTKQGDNGNWITISFTSSVDISGNSGNHQLIFNALPFDKVRILYTRTSGTGTLNATITHKSVGA